MKLRATINTRTFIRAIQLSWFNPLIEPESPQEISAEEHLPPPPKFDVAALEMYYPSYDFVQCFLDGPGSRVLDYCKPKVSLEKID